MGWSKEIKISHCYSCGEILLGVQDSKHDALNGLEHSLSLSSSVIGKKFAWAIFFKQTNLLHTVIRKIKSSIWSDLKNFGLILILCNKYTIQFTKKMVYKQLIYKSYPIWTLPFLKSCRMKKKSRLATACTTRDYKKAKKPMLKKLVDREGSWIGLALRRSKVYTTHLFW